MGSIIYDFLADSLLFHQKSINTNFQNETDSRIEQEIQAYRQHCLDNYPTIIDEIKNKKSDLKVFSSTENTSLSLLKQTALYVEQFIISDPLFKLTHRQGEQAKVTSSFLGYLSDEIDRKRLSSAVSFLKEITPMVAGDYIKLFPLNLYFEGPEQIPINFPQNYNNDILPKPILDFFWDHAEVRSLRKMEGGGWSFTNELVPCRGIVVNFHGEDFSKPGMIYHLFEMQVIDSDDATMKVTVAHTLPDTPPDEEYFQAWVSQSINSSASNFFEKVYLENFIASNFDATYLCDNSFTGELITKSFDTKETIQTFTANQVLNFELPFLDKIDTQKLMNIRELDADVFTNFRMELEKQFRELRALTDPKQIQLKTENIFHELNQVQVEKIKQKIDHHKKQMRLNALLAIGGLAGSMQTSGLSLLGTATALGKGYKDYKDYREKVRENPAYLLWKIKK